MNVPKKNLFIVAVLIGLLIVTACASKKTPAHEGAEVAEERVVKETVVVEKEVEKVVAATMVVEKEQVAQAEPAQPPPAAEDTSGSRGDVGTVPQASPRRSDRMIIKDADLDLLVTDTDVGIDRVTQVAIDSFGYVLSSRTWYDDDFKYATITIGVPSEEYETALRRLRGIAIRVLNESASGTDVTDQYVDLQSRLINLEATEATIRSFLDKAETVEESLRVNKELSQITAQIEEIKGKMNYLKDRAAYSTITVNLQPELPTPTPTPTATVTPTPTATPTATPIVWKPDETFDTASSILVRIFRALGNLAIWFVVVLGPFLVPLALLVWLAIWLRRKRRKPESKGEEKEPEPE
jgi:hypothetical protein